MSNHMNIMMMMMITMGLLTTASQRKHLLNTIMGLELTMLSILMMMMMFFTKTMNETTFILTLITLAACESALSLTILVTMIRGHGNDLFKTFSTL